MRRQQARITRDAPRGESGQVSLLIVGFSFLLLLAVALVVNTSAAYLQRQSLDTIADGAALHAVDAGVGGLGLDGLGDGRLSVDPDLARRAVQHYLSATGARRSHPGLRHEVVVGADGAVSVRVEAPLEFPLRIPGAPRRTVVGASARAAVTVLD